MNKATEQQLKLPISPNASTEQIALALKNHFRTLPPGETLPPAADYAVANRLQRQIFYRAFTLLKKQGVIRRNRARRHELT